MQLRCQRSWRLYHGLIAADAAERERLREQRRRLDSTLDGDETILSGDGEADG